MFCFTLCSLPHIEQIKSSSWREKHSCTGTEERARVWAILPPRGCWPSSHSPSSTHTHCPHSAAIWPAGKSEPPETRPNTWCSLTTRASLLIVKRWIKIIQAHKVHGRTTYKKKNSYSFHNCEVKENLKVAGWSFFLFQNRREFLSIPLCPFIIINTLCLHVLLVHSAITRKNKTFVVFENFDISLYLNFDNLLYPC